MLVSVNTGFMGAQSFPVRELSRSLAQEMKVAYVGGEGRSVVWETWTWYFNYEL